MTKIMKESYKLDTIEDTRVLLADITNACIAGEIDDNRAKRLGFIGQTMIYAIKTQTINERLTALENVIVTTDQ